MSFDLYVQSTPHHVSKHDVVLRTSQFRDVRCKTWEDLSIFSQSSTVIFITISTWCQSLWIFQCNGFRKWLPTASWSKKTVKENSFSKGSRLFSHIMQSILLVLLEGCFKRLAFPSSAICYIMKMKNIKLYKYSTLLLNIQWSHLVYEMNDFRSIQ